MSGGEMENSTLRRSADKACSVKQEQVYPNPYLLLCGAGPAFRV